MHANLVKIIEDARASYWFIPGCITIFSLALAFFMEWLDVRYASDWLRDAPWLTATRPEGARAVLTAIASSIIGVAGVTFSITIVAVSFASANYGPRLIGNFMRDRSNQFTLGIFIGTFVYCLTILRTVRTADSGYEAFVPHFSILVALALALASIGMLIYFIHHVPETINVGNIAAKIGRNLEEDIAKLFPDVGEMSEPRKKAVPAWSDRESLTRSSVKSKIAGYVQALDEERLVEIAYNQSLLVEVQYRPGDFLVNGAPVLQVFSKDALSEDNLDALTACYAIGQHRTAHQNALFLVDQLVEVIARALSPGVNDPFTAISCFNWLHNSLVCFCERDSEIADQFFPVHAHRIDFDRFASAVFDQSRQYVARDRNVALHVVAIITESAIRAKNEEQRAILLLHLKKLAEASAEALGEDGGAAEIGERYDEAIKLLYDPGYRAESRESPSWFGGRA